MPSNKPRYLSFRDFNIDSDISQVRIFLMDGRGWVMDRQDAKRLGELLIEHSKLGGKATSVQPLEEPKRGGKGKA